MKLAPQGANGLQIGGARCVHIQVKTSPRLDNIGKQEKAYGLKVSPLKMSFLAVVQVFTENC